MNLKELKTEEILNLYADILQELNDRHVIRTHNSPVGDYAECLVSKKMDLMLAPNSEKGYDAIGRGIRYQVKSRWEHQDIGTGSRILGAIRDYDAENFDYIIALFFDKAFRVKEAYQIPRELVKIYGRYDKHKNCYVLIVNSQLLQDSRVENLIHIFT